MSGRHPSVQIRDIRVWRPHEENGSSGISGDRSLISGPKGHNRPAWGRAKSADRLVLGRFPDRLGGFGPTDISQNL
jgi:hypothetical protein